MHLSSALLHERRSCNLMSLFFNGLIWIMKLSVDGTSDFDVFLMQNEGRTGDRQA